jgi:cellulase/cellobiase CelA1
LAALPATSQSTSTVCILCVKVCKHANNHTAIVAIFKKYPNIAIALIIEPDSLPNLVTNIDLQTCIDSAAGYRDGVAYALKSLNLPNIAMYIDAGHGGWLGWNDNLSMSSSPRHVP